MDITTTMDTGLLLSEEDKDELIRLIMVLLKLVEVLGQTHLTWKPVDFTTNG